ncbi:hypothetical protein D6856_07645 [Butyrivibrio sp. XB500-5]|uniref:NADase-type glycan-binding domain-containing protein n=1 Tax=Butyrivibrio sp. XB500-5 TaxID=2364880 RepID=UPI000EAA92AF|nr:discoidin domain-containing protein [Butyrivibrio sp. XB500-5]RKM60912.1 hypothetical protein D6856_07645 [Butyrivibrio sp. XB500-5]
MKKSFIAMAISVMVSAAAVGCTSADVQEQGAINTETTQEATEEVTQEATEQATEETSEEASTDTASSEDSSSDESSEAATEGASNDSKSEASDADASTAKADDKKDTASSDNEYDSTIDKLLKTKAVTPDKEELLSDMARVVTISNVLDKNGVFSKADNNSKARLRNQVIRYSTYENSELKKIASLKTGEEDYKTVVSVEDAKKIWLDFYGEDDFNPGEYEDVKDGKIYYSFGDGEQVALASHCEYHEDDEYFLFTGPVFEGHNINDGTFKGYADILFKKNTDSVFGFTAIYGRYRKDTVKVASVTTSSELAASKGKNYSGKNLIDGDYSTVWCEGAKGEGVGETITLKLDKKQSVNGVQICNGYTASYDLHHSNGVLTDIEVDFGNGKKVSVDLFAHDIENETVEDLVEDNLNHIELDEPVETDTITIKITGAKKGAKYDDTCVSEIMVY